MTCSSHVEMAPYEDDTAIMSTSRKPTFFISHLESSQQPSTVADRMENTMNVSKSSAIIFVRTGRPFIWRRLVTRLGEPIKLVDPTRYLWATLDKRLTWSLHIEQVIIGTAQMMVSLVPLLYKRSDLHQERSPAIQACYPPPDELRSPCLEVRCPYT
jgi:hypothetical protein